MFRKKRPPIVLLSLLVGFCVALLFVRSWPELILAQEDTEPAETNQIFLPYVAQDASMATLENTTPPASDGHNHAHPQPLVDSWPPQPEGVTEVVWLATTTSPEVIAAQAASHAAEQVALASAAVQTALGERFVQAATTYVHQKTAANASAAALQNGKEDDSVRVAYFSYSHNVTVEALVQAGAVTEVKTLAAATYQPEPTHAEKQQATALARTYFAEQGFERLQQLEGYVIQAYQTEGSTGFYATRVLYVTFHERIDERPEFVAWVDLTNETVIKGFQDSYQVTPNEEAQQ